MKNAINLSITAALVFMLSLPLLAYDGETITRPDKTEDQSETPVLSADSNQDSLEELLEVSPNSSDDIMTAFASCALSFAAICAMKNTKHR